MQKFDIPLTDREPKATPAPETPSKRKAFSMMEAKPVPRPEPYGAGPRETPAQETPSARRRSSRLETQTETEEVKHVASLRKYVAETSYRPASAIDKENAKIKILKGRIKGLIGHLPEGKNADEIKSNVTLGDKFGIWLGKITGKKTDSSSLDKLLEQLKLAEKTLEVLLTPDISVVEPGSIARKPRTLRSIKSRIEELETRQASQAEKDLDAVHIEIVEPEVPTESLAARIEAAKAKSIAGQAATTNKPRTLRTRIKEIEAKQSVEAEKALEEVPVEVVEPEAPKESLATRIEAAKARGVKNRTLGVEDIKPEIKTSPLAESVRMPEEESMEVDLSELNEGASEPELLQKTHFEGLIDGDLIDTDILQPGTPLYEFRGQGKVYEKLTELGELIKAEEADAYKLTDEIEALNKKFKKSSLARRPKIQEQIDAKLNELFNNDAFLSKQDALLSEARAGAEELKKESSSSRKKFRQELATEITKEKFESGAAKGAEAKFLFDATKKLDDILFYSKRNPDYEDLARQRNHPKISKLLDELFKQDIQKKIEGDARLEEEEILRGDLRAKKASKQEFDRSLSAFQKETLDKADQWATEYEARVDKIAATAKEIGEEASLPEAEVIEEKAPSEMAPPPPTARERKRRLELQDALAGRSIKEGPTVEVGEGELTPEEIKAAYGEEEVKFDEESVQGKKLLEAGTELLGQLESASWFKSVVQDHPLIAKYAENEAVATLLKDLRDSISIFDARRDGIIERAKGKFSKKIIQELRDLSVERSEMVNHATDELEATAKRLEQGESQELPEPDHNENSLDERISHLAKRAAVKLGKGRIDDNFDDAYIQLTKDRNALYGELLVAEDNHAKKTAKEIQKEINALQAQIDKKNDILREAGVLGENEDPSKATTGKSGIGRMGVIGSDMVSKRVQRGKYEGDVHSGAREKTRSKLERTARLETKELQPFNTAWAIEKLGNGAAKRWDLVAPIIMEAELGATIEREVNDMLKKIKNLPYSKKVYFSDEYHNLPQIMDIVRHTERFNQSPETAAYIFLRALSPAGYSDYLAQDIVEETLAKLDREIFKAYGSSASRARQWQRSATSTVKSEAPKAKKARTVRTSGKDKAA